MDIDLAGNIIKMRALNQGDDAIKAKCLSMNYQENAIDQTMDAVDRDDILEVNTIWILTPINPITYLVGMNKISVNKRIFWGVMHNNDEIGIRTIDNVRIAEGIISATIIVVHADRSEVRIQKISKIDARNIEKLFGYIIEAQRSRVVNVATD